MAALPVPVSSNFLPFQSGGRDYVVDRDAVVAIVPLVDAGEGTRLPKWVVVGRGPSGLCGVYADAVGEPIHSEDIEISGIEPRS